MNNTLAYYLKLACTTAGVVWDRDNEAEVNGVVDDINTEFDKLRKRVLKLEAQLEEMRK